MGTVERHDTTMSRHCFVGEKERREGERGESNRRQAKKIGQLTQCLSWPLSMVSAAVVFLVYVVLVVLSDQIGSLGVCRTRIVEGQRRLLVECTTQGQDQDPKRSKNQRIYASEYVKSLVNKRTQGKGCHRI